MTIDWFCKTCLAATALLLGIMIYNQSGRAVKAAPPAEYMVEGNSGQDTSVVNAHMKKRVAEGWTLHTFGANYMVWQK